MTTAITTEATATDLATPRPWNYIYSNLLGGFVIAQVPGFDIAELRLTASRNERQQGANAALIVRAVNSFDALLIAVQEMQHYIKGNIPESKVKTRLLKLSNAALAQADGGGENGGGR